MLRLLVSQYTDDGLLWPSFSAYDQSPGSIDMRACSYICVQTREKKISKGEQNWTQTKNEFDDDKGDIIESFHSSHYCCPLSENVIHDRCQIVLQEGFFLLFLFFPVWPPSPSPLGGYFLDSGRKNSRTLKETHELLFFYQFGSFPFICCHRL